MNQLPRYSIAAAMCMLAACSRGTSASSGATAGGQASSSSQWIANGRTACAKYLTPDVVGTILTRPAGQAKELSAQACAFEAADGGGNIGITLTQGGPAAFTAMRPYWSDPVALAGVGDSAVRTTIGIQAVKGNGRSCAIDAGGAPGETKVTGEALAQELGKICNALFALP